MSHLQLCDPASVFAAVPYAKRLRARMVSSAQALQRAPDQSFPHAFTAAGYTGFIRMLKNPRVRERPPMAEVCADTVRRLAPLGRALAIHDTSEMVFGGEVRRDGLGRLHAHTQGFLAHTCLAVEADGRRGPVGVLSLEAVVRAETPFTDKGSLNRYDDPFRESQRWHRGVRAAEKAVGRAGVLLHLFDREADDYLLLLQMRDEHCAFIVRQRVDRVLSRELVTDTVRTARALVHVAAVPVVGRAASISRRSKRRSPDELKRHPARDAREARLEVEAMRVSVQRPKPLAATFAPSVPLNLVHVREVDVPAGEAPVDWWLWTSEPIDTPEQVLQIVDWYCARWVVEEFFKVLKTGCRYEDRQLESFDALWIALAVLLPIATRLLQLRHAARETPTRDAREIVSVEAIDVLRASGRCRLPETPNAHEILLAVAAMGGHIKSNGPPGWLVLWRGMRDLETQLVGWRAARAMIDAPARGKEHP
jgi:hypothetical protein